MHINKLKDVTIIDASRGKYLALKNNKSEEIIGKPIRIVLDNSTEVPEFEERLLN